MLKTAAENPRASVSFLYPIELFLGHYGGPEHAAQNVLPWRSICFEPHMTEQKLMQERIKRVHEMMDSADIYWGKIALTLWLNDGSLKGTVMKWGEG